MADDKKAVCIQMDKETEKMMDVIKAKTGLSASSEVIRWLIKRYYDKKIAKNE